jgi:hypothetical protein
MFFTNAKHARRQQMSTLNDVSSNNREAIRAKMKETEAIDSQLREILKETKILTLSVREKVNSQLKITQKSIKSLCQNFGEGVVIANHRGEIVEVNDSCENVFGIKKDTLVGQSFAYLADKLKTEKESGESFTLDTEFFELLSKNLFNRIVCDCDCKTCITPRCLGDIKKYFADFNPTTETVLFFHPCERTQKAMFSFTVIDNDPDMIEDVTYIMFFKLQQ